MKVTTPLIKYSFGRSVGVSPFNRGMGFSGANPLEQLRSLLENAIGQDPSQLTVTLSQMLEKQGNTDIKCDMALAIGEHFWGLGNLPAALTFYQTAKTVAKTPNEKNKALLGLGNCVGEPQERLTHYEEARKLAMSERLFPLAAEALILKGDVKPQKDRGVCFYREAINLAEEKKLPYYHAKALIGLGNSLHAKNELNERLDAYKTALTIIEPNLNPKLSPEVLKTWKTLKAKAHMGLGNARDENRIGHYQIAVGIAEEIKDKHLQGQALFYLANALQTEDSKIGDDPKREERYKLYLKASQLIDPNRYLELASKIYLNMGHTNPNRDEAIRNYESAAQIATRAGYHEVAFDAYYSIGLQGKTPALKYAALLNAMGSVRFIKDNIHPLLTKVRQELEKFAPK